MISSLRPVLYTSAVSRKLPPPETYASMIACEVASSASAPKVMVPSAWGKTTAPLRPSMRYVVPAGPGSGSALMSATLEKAPGRERHVAARGPASRRTAPPRPIAPPSSGCDDHLAERPSFPDAGERVGDLLQ